MTPEAERRYEQVTGRYALVHWVDEPKTGRVCKVRVVAKDCSGMFHTVERWCLEYETKFWPTSARWVGRIVEGDLYEYEVQLRRMPAFIRREYLGEERAEREVDNTEPLTVLDSHGSLPESVIEKARHIHAVTDMPGVVLVVERKNRRRDSWSGRARNSRDTEHVFRGKVLKLVHPAYLLKCCFGERIRPVARDKYKAWMGSLTGEGTLLALIVHEMVHAEFNSLGWHEPERTVTKRAVELCRKHYPDLFTTDTEVWSRAYEASRNDDTLCVIRRDGSAHGEYSLAATQSERSSTMRVGAESKDYVVVRIGRGKDAEVLKVHDATAEDVDKVVASVIGAEPQVTTVRVKKNGKGNRPFIHRTAVATDKAAAAIKKALQAASAPK